MFTFIAPAKKTELEDARTDAINELNCYRPEDPEYTKIIAHVTTLSNLIAAEKPEKLSPNTIVIAGVNVVIAVIVVSFESKNVWSSKVMSLMLKLK